MWLSPRVTIRRIVEAEIRPSWIPILALLVVGEVLGSSQVEPGTWAIAADTYGPIGLNLFRLAFGLLVGPFLLALVGGWFGGEAYPEDLREAIVWSSLPAAVAALFWIPLVFAFGTRALGGEIEPTSPLQWIAVLALVGMAGAYLWSMVLHVLTVAELQRFSILKASVCFVILLLPLLLITAFG
jgi:hypothetical protein